MMFGDIVCGEMHLSEYGKIAENDLLCIPQHYENARVDKHIIMPNHLHAIIALVGAPLAAPAERQTALSGETGRASASPTIGNIVRGYKAGVSQSVGFAIWQRSYHDHIIRNEPEYQKIWQYIDENPAKWTKDCYYKK